MKKGKLIEQKQLTQINLNEANFVSRTAKALIRLLGKPLIKRAVRKLDKAMKDDSDVQAAIADYHATRERLQDRLKYFCKYQPDNEFCLKKGKKK